MHKIVTLHLCEALVFLGTSPPFQFKRFPEILDFISSSCYMAAWTPLKSSRNNPTHPATYNEWETQQAALSLPEKALQQI